MQHKLDGSGPHACAVAGIKRPPAQIAEGKDQHGCHWSAQMQQANAKLDYTRAYIKFCLLHQSPHAQTMQEVNISYKEWPNLKNI